MDQSELDDQYFIDNKKFNCPFCNRRHVSYHISGSFVFQWDDKKNCFCYYVKCESCDKTSMHLTFFHIPTLSRQYARGQEFNLNAKKKNDDGEEETIFELGDRKIDDLFFYSVPTSFFTVDKRIPRKLRELLLEAEGCLKSNYLTGASVCVRKLVYELAILEKAEGDNYDDRIKSLKAKKTEVDEMFFDTLLTIQQVTSSKVHEQAYDGWNSNHLKLLISALTEILNEIYVIPALRKEKRSAILSLKKEVIGS